MTEFQEYRGMSYEQASREAECLIQCKGWFQSFDRLAHLHQLMQREAGRSVAA